MSTGDSIDTGALLYVLAAHAAAEFGTGSETT